MNENKSKFEQVFDNLYIRAEREGTAKFDNEQDMESSKNETIELYRQYYDLVSRKNAAYDKTRATAQVWDSKEEKRAVKEKNKEGKRELKVVDKQIKEITKIIEDKTAVMFNLVGVGGYAQARKMILNAYEADLKEKTIREKQEARALKMASFCPKENVNENEARKAAENSGKQVEKEDSRDID